MSITLYTVTGLGVLTPQAIEAKITPEEVLSLLQVTASIQDSNPGVIVKPEKRGLLLRFSGVPRRYLARKEGQMRELLENLELQKAISAFEIYAEPDQG